LKKLKKRMSHGNIHSPSLPPPGPPSGPPPELPSQIGPPPPSALPPNRFRRPDTRSSQLSSAAREFRPSPGPPPPSYYQPPQSQPYQGHSGPGSGYATPDLRPPGSGYATPYGYESGPPSQTGYSPGPPAPPAPYQPPPQQGYSAQPYGAPAPVNADRFRRPPPDGPMTGFGINQQKPPPQQGAAGAGFFLKPLPPKLPVEKYKERILKMIDERQVSMIHGATGSGKSTMVPQFILDNPDYRHPKNKKKKPNIIITQPRRITCSSIAGFVAKLRKGKIGEEVGYALGRGTKIRRYSRTKLYYVTTGYLAETLMHYPEFLEQFDYVVLDEVHERSLENDLVVRSVRQSIQNNPGQKLVLMSATLEARVWQNYFNAHERPISIETQVHPTDLYFTNNLDRLFDRFERQGINTGIMRTSFMRNYVETLNNLTAGSSCASVQKAQSELVFQLIMMGSTIGNSTLVFLGGIDFIQTIADKIVELADDRWRLIILHSSFPLVDDDEILPVEGKFNVYLSSNVAESSITINMCDFVIDTCLARRIVVENKKQILKSVWASQASLKQRAGRTGRVLPGIAVRCIPKRCYEGLDESGAPEIETMNPEELVFRLKKSLNGPIITMTSDLPSPPDLNIMESALKDLYLYGVLTSENDDESQLTKTGHIMSSIPLSFHMSRWVIIGCYLGIGPDAIILSVLFSLDADPFYHSNPLRYPNPMDYAQNICKTMRKRRSLDGGTQSELIGYIRLFHEFHGLMLSGRRGTVGQWCYEHSLYQTKMKLWHHLVANICTQMDKTLEFPGRGWLGCRGSVASLKDKKGDVKPAEIASPAKLAFFSALVSPENVVMLTMNAPDKKAKKRWKPDQHEVAFRDLLPPYDEPEDLVEGLKKIIFFHDPKNWENDDIPLDEHFIEECLWQHRQIKSNKRNAGMEVNFHGSDATSMAAALKLRIAILPYLHRAKQGRNTIRLTAPRPPTPPPREPTPPPPKNRHPLADIELPEGVTFHQATQRYPDKRNGPKTPSNESGPPGGRGTNPLRLGDEKREPVHIPYVTVTVQIKEPSAKMANSNSSINRCIVPKQFPWHPKSFDNPDRHGVFLNATYVRNVVFMGGMALFETFDYEKWRFLLQKSIILNPHFEGTLGWEPDEIFNAKDRLAPHRANLAERIDEVLQLKGEQKDLLADIEEWMGMPQATPPPPTPPPTPPPKKKKKKKNKNKNKRNKKKKGQGGGQQGQWQGRPNDQFAAMAYYAQQGGWGSPQDQGGGWGWQAQDNWGNPAQQMAGGWGQPAAMGMGQIYPGDFRVNPSAGGWESYGSPLSPSGRMRAEAPAFSPGAGAHNVDGPPSPKPQSKKSRKKKRKQSNRGGRSGNSRGGRSGDQGRQPQASELTNRSPQRPPSPAPRQQRGNNKNRGRGGKANRGQSRNKKGQPPPPQPSGQTSPDRGPSSRGKGTRGGRGRYRRRNRGK